MENNELRSHLFEMQEAQRAWAKENFGVQTPIQMLMGILGELGEFGELAANYVMSDTDALIDAIGDVGIYLMNYCNLKGWLLSVLMEHMAPPPKQGDPWDIMYYVRWLPHHQLKGDQNIRGGTGYHDARMQVVLSSMLWQLNEVAKLLGARGDPATGATTFFECLCKTWSKVSKRDWVLHPNDAHVIAGDSDD